MIPHYPNTMADQDHSGPPQPGPPQPDRMRDSDYVVRGYKAALFNRSMSHADITAPQRNSRLTAWLEDISYEDRHRARVGLDGQPYDAAAARAVSEDREGKESSGDEK